MLCSLGALAPIDGTTAREIRAIARGPPHPRRMERDRARPRHPRRVASSSSRLWESALARGDVEHYLRAKETRGNSERAGRTSTVRTEGAASIIVLVQSRRETYEATSHDVSTSSQWRFRGTMKNPRVMR